MSAVEQQAAGAEQDEGQAIPRCATCRWWADLYSRPELRGEDGESLYVDNDYSKPIPAPGRWGWCKKVAEFGPTASDKFYVIDGSEYRANLNCRDDFGCVEHEAIAFNNNDTEGQP